MPDSLLDRSIEDESSIIGSAGILANGDDDKEKMWDVERMVVSGQLGDGSSAREEDPLTDYKKTFRSGMLGSSQHSSHSEDNDVNDFMKEFTSSRDDTAAESEPRQMHYINSGYQRSSDENMEAMTQEQIKQQHINKVLGKDDDDIFDIDKEKEEDDKTAMLEQIDSLKETLVEDQVDISRVPEVNSNSSFDEIKSVLKVLTLKNDRNRYCSLAEELFLSGAYGLETAFDGQREWLGRKPDLTGWSDAVKIKLRRMRHETSTFVSGIMQEYKIGAGMRLLLELVPSMILHSRKRRQQVSKHDNIADDIAYKEAIQQLNDVR